MGDYKAAIQELAEQIVYNNHNEYFYDLKEEIRDKVYKKAEEQYWDRF